jgi:hypothetical protein
MKTQPIRNYGIQQRLSVLRGKFIAMSAYIKNTETFQINNLILHLKLLEKQEQAKPKTSSRGEIIKIRTEVKETETKKTKESVKQKVGSLKK